MINKKNTGDPTETTNHQVVNDNYNSSSDYKNTTDETRAIALNQFRLSTRDMKNLVDALHTARVEESNALFFARIEAIRCKIISVLEQGVTNLFSLDEISVIHNALQVSYEKCKLKLELVSMINKNRTVKCDLCDNAAIRIRSIKDKEYNVCPECLAHLDNVDANRINGPRVIFCEATKDYEEAAITIGKSEFLVEVVDVYLINKNVDYVTFAKFDLKDANEIYNTISIFLSNKEPVFKMAIQLNCRLTTNPSKILTTS